MRAAYAVQTVRAAERAHEVELASGALMRRAAWALAGVVVDRLRSAGVRIVGARIVLLVGRGNNGGDVLCAGALLARRGAQVTCVQLFDALHADGRRALAASGGRFLGPLEPDGTLSRSGPSLPALPALDPSGVRACLRASDVVIDGITGISGRPGLLGAAAEVVHELADVAALIVAADVPSGVDADTGRADGVHVRADITVTFGCLKPGLVCDAGREASGEVVVADIGIADALTEAVPACLVLDGADADAAMRPLDSADHKYRRGVVGVAAGSPEFPGAAVLTVAAAARSGAGMVVFWDHDATAPSPVAQAVLLARPDAVRSMQRPVDQSRVTAWACGPGLTAADGHVVAAVLATDVPVVLDAGALTCLAADGSLRAMVRERSTATILTPHDGEAARLAAALGWVPGGDRRADATHLAQALQCVVLWKGPGTVVVDGRSLAPVPWIDAHGGPELSCAGSGDVLTGLLAGLLASGEHPPRGDAAWCAAAAAWLHAEAGRRALSVGGPVTALDLVAELRGIGAPS